jgi:hypothetical protein
MITLSVELLVAMILLNNNIYFHQTSSLCMSTWCRKRFLFLISVIDSRPYRTSKALAVYQFILFCLSGFFLVYLFFLSMVVSNLSRHRWDRDFENLRHVNLHFVETLSTWWDSHPKPRDYCFSIPIKAFDADQDFKLFLPRWAFLNMSTLQLYFLDTKKRRKKKGQHGPYMLIFSIEQLVYMTIFLCLFVGWYVCVVVSCLFLRCLLL